MAGVRGKQWCGRYTTAAVVGCVWLSLAAAGAALAFQGPPPSRGTSPRTYSLEPGAHESVAVENVKSGETYGLTVTLLSGRLADDDRVQVELVGAGADRISKELHAGDPDLFLPYRPRADGEARVSLARTEKKGSARLDVKVAWTHLSIPVADRAAIEAEPNDSWRRQTSCGSAATSTARPTTSTTSKTPQKGRRASTGSDSR